MLQQFDKSLQQNSMAKISIPQVWLQKWRRNFVCRAHVRPPLVVLEQFESGEVLSVEDDGSQDARPQFARWTPTNDIKKDL